MFYKFMYYVVNWFVFVKICRTQVANFGRREILI